jgi:hypothetical protein
MGMLRVSRTGGLDAEALFVSKRRGDAVIRNI